MRRNVDLEFDREEVACVAHRIVFAGGRSGQWHPAYGRHERDEPRVEYGRFRAEQNGIALLAPHEVHVEFAVQVAESRIRDAGGGNGQFDAFARCQWLGQRDT